MAQVLTTRAAEGGPGIAPKWTSAAKQGVGTAYNTSSRVWFTLHSGIVTECFYPTVDRPQIRDWQLVVTDGQSFVLDEERRMNAETRPLARHVLGYEVVNRDPDGRFTLRKTIISDPHNECVLQSVRVEGDEPALSGLQWHVLLAPHLGGAGENNNAFLATVRGQTILAAERDGVWLASCATVPFAEASCGYVGATDGWQQLSQNFRLVDLADHALDGNVALCGRLDTGEAREWVMGLAFGDSLNNAVTTLLQSLSLPFADQEARFREQWERADKVCEDLDPHTGDGGSLYRTSYSQLLAHQDKMFNGASVASLAKPWGEVHGDEDGYHYVWGRDLYISATGLIASGDEKTPLNTLIYLACVQDEDGGFAQNFHVDGEAHWRGIQLDQVAFPILLAYHLYRRDALQGFSARPMMLAAAGYLLRHGATTPQERWEENAGYSPSTLAVMIAALIICSRMAREAGDEDAACYLEDAADFLESRIEAWTVTSQGSLVEGITRHFVRITPPGCDGPDAPDAQLHIASTPPGEPDTYGANQIVDGGFLELVRYGIRAANDPLIVDTVRVMDQVLKTDTPHGPLWHRYNHDGYGQKPDGSAYRDWGVGRAWPLLTGERGIYEVAAGRDPAPLIRTLENIARASEGNLLPEQAWDADDLPDLGLHTGGPTGAAMPLMWAHAEYIKLLRSRHENESFDFLPFVAERYQGDRKANPQPPALWTLTTPAGWVARGQTLRVQADAPFCLRFSTDDWRTVNDQDAGHVAALGVFYADIPIPDEPGAEQVRFTFLWTNDDRWEGRDFAVRVA